MTIRDKRTGVVYTNAAWLGINWIRAWVGGRDGGYLHWFAGDVGIVE